MFIVVIDHPRAYVGPFTERVEAELYAQEQAPVDFPENDAQVELLKPPRRS